MSIAVFGSINMDVTAYMHRLPKPGETLQGTEYKLGLGGKGANQAVAARKLGSDVAFICRLGADDFAKPAERELASYGVDLALVRKDDGGATGIAIINVGEGGENYISLIGGSNLRVDATDVARAPRAGEGEGAAPPARGAALRLAGSSRHRPVPWWHRDPRSCPRARRRPRRRGAAGGGHHHAQ
jgi:ribokinase